MTDSNILHLLKSPVRFVAGFRNRTTPYCIFHHHPDLEIVYHLQGAGYTTPSGKAPIEFNPHDVVLYPPNAPHDQKMTTQGIDVCIHVAFAHGAPKVFQETLNITNVQDSFLRAELIRLSEATSPSDDLETAALNHRATGLMIGLLRRALTGNASVPLMSGEEYTEAANEYIRANFRTIRSIEEVAGHVGVSYSHLRHIFKSRYGISIKQWLANIRIEEAKKLLNHSPLPHKTIAKQCGFANERYFCTCFRAAAGVSPRAFRNSRASVVRH